MNFSDLGKMKEMMSQAREMQAQMEQKLASTIVEAESGGGMVTVRMNGKKEVLRLKIEPTALGASTGDLLSQSRHDGGLGLGTTVTSIIFLVAILIVVTFLSVTKRDVTEIAAYNPEPHAQVLVVANKTAASPPLLDAAQVGPAGRHRAL